MDMATTRLLLMWTNLVVRVLLMVSGAALGAATESFWPPVHRKPASKNPRHLNFLS